MNIDGLTLHALLEELKPQIMQGRIDKIFQPQKQNLLLWIRCPGATQKLTISTAANHSALFLTEQKLENPAVAPVFCMVLRKHLEGGRISDLAQHQLDRLFFLDIDLRGASGFIETKRLAVELTGKNSNVILLDSQGVIIDALRRIGGEQNRYRQILPGEPYVCPPNEGKINPLFISPAEALAELQSVPASIHLKKAIIKVFYGFGPQTVAELIFRAKLAPQELVGNLTARDWEALGQVLTELQNLDRQQAWHPHFYQQDCHKSLFPLTMQTLTEVPGKIDSTFSAVMEQDFFSQTGSRPFDSENWRKLLAHELGRLERKQIKLTSELQQAELAEQVKQAADLLMANLYNLPKHATEVTLPDFYANNEPRLIALNPALSPSENVQSLYLHYQKQKRAQSQLAEQLHQTKQDLNYVESLLMTLDQAETIPDFEQIRDEMQQIRLLKPLHKKRPAPTPAKPIIIQLPQGHQIWIGKNNRQNDELTFKIAKAKDLWFHTKDIPGSHVVLRTAGSEPVPADILKTARIAAYFSKARNSSKVPVDYTERRFVKKPAGAKPGFVIYEEQTTVYVTPDEQEIKELRLSSD